jgi:hypothetical protein
MWRGQLKAIKVLKKVGRKTAMTEDKIAKLEDGFLKGLSDTEACLYSNVAPSTLYLYCKENPQFSERKTQLKENVRMRAKLNIAEGIEAKDRLLSQWYLERKAKDEFSTRQELTGKDGKDLFTPTDEEQQKIDNALETLHNGDTK